MSGSCDGTRSVDDPHVAFGLQPGEEVLHLLEALGRVNFPLRDLADDPHLPGLRQTISTSMPTIGPAPVDPAVAPS